MREAAPAPHSEATLRPGPILPMQDGRDGALSFVIAVICALACLAVLTGAAADRATRGWQDELQGSATVQVRPRPGETGGEAAARAAEALAGAPGVLEARAQARSEAVKLLEPWLGKGGVPDDLPIPQLVTLQLDPARPPSAEALTAALRQAGVDADLDDHGRWLKDVQRTALIVRLGAIGAALVLALTAAAAVRSAARAGLAARREVVEVLHLSGAEDGYIAGLVQTRFGRMAAVAGVQGLAVAVLIWWAVRFMSPNDGLTPLLPQRWTDLWLVLPAPLLVGAIGAISARGSAMTILRLTVSHGPGGA